MPNRNYPQHGVSSWWTPGAQQQVQPGYGVLQQGQTMAPGYTYNSPLDMGPPTYSQSLQNLTSQLMSGDMDPNKVAILAQLQSMQQGQSNFDANTQLYREALEAQKQTPFQQGMGTFGNVMQGIGSMANIYMGLQGMREQKRNNSLQREVLNTNLNNSIADYNRRLEGILRSRAVAHGNDDSWVQSELERHSARRG